MKHCRKKFRETESVKKKDINEDVPEIKDPSLSDFEELIKKYEQLKKVY